MLSGCDKPKSYQYEIWSDTEEYPAIVFYPLNYSMFIALYYTSSEVAPDILQTLPFAYGSYWETDNKITFFDSISTMKYEFIKNGNSLFSSHSGIFKSFRLKALLMSDNDMSEKENLKQSIKLYRTLLKNRKQFLDILFEKEHVYLKNNLILKDKIFCDSDCLMKIQFIKDNWFKIIIGDNFIMRAGTYTLRDGKILFHDTLTSHTEEAVMLTDTSIVSVDLPFYLSVRQFSHTYCQDTSGFGFKKQIPIP